MTFKLFGKPSSLYDNKPPKDYAQEAKELLMVKHSLPTNTKKWGQFDTSIINDDDVVLLVDGDWLCFTSASEEMERFINVYIDGVKHKFKGMTQYKDWCKENNRLDEYKKHKIEKGQYNHPKAISFAKASVKKKIRKGIEATGATKVVIFCGSTGNHRNELPLPMLCDKKYYNYKGQREGEWIPDTLSEIKDWSMSNWLSHWAVFEESDDCITIAKHTLFKRGIKCYTYGVDKDFCQDHIGGLFLVGRHETPVYFQGKEEDKLGWVKAVKTSGNSDKMLGQGDKFLCYQILTYDTVDNYSAYSVLRKYGTLKNFSYTQCAKYLNQFNTQQELWQGVYDFFTKHLPSEFEYVDCFGNTVKSSPLHMLDLHFKCACMRTHKDHVCDVVEDRLKPLGVKYD